MKQYRMLVFIVVLIAIAIWIDLPNNPGIHIGNINKTIKTNLGLDLVGGVQALLEADLPASTAVTSEAMSTARTIVENRVNGLGVSEAVVQLAGARRIVVEIPGEVDPNQAISTIQETGLLEFVDMDSNPLSEGTVVQTDFGQSSASGVITSTGSLSATATTLPTTEPPTPTSVVSTTTATAAPNATPQVQYLSCIR
jgi:preprotein translocase subunit SecD